MLSGPNTGTGHTSQIFMIECQLNYVVDALEELGDGPEAVAEVLPDVAQAHADELERRILRTVWASGCASWYQNGRGRNVAMWPDYTFVYRRRTRHFDASDYVIGTAPERASSPRQRPAAPGRRRASPGRSPAGSRPRAAALPQSPSRTLRRSRREARVPRRSSHP